MSRLLAAMLLLALAGCGREEAQPAGPPPANPVEAGRYLVQAGDCAACHTQPGGMELAGGRAIVTPYGAIYSTNLTPDTETGLGQWSAEDFWQAMHHGRSRDRGLLYPAFPYTNFTRLSRIDSDSIYAYLKSLAPVRSATPAPGLRFPYNQRWLMGLWRTLYFRAGSYQPDAGKSAAWNRGAYLVQGLGHCDACHSRRNALGAVKGGSELHGGMMGGGWYAPPIAGDQDAQLARLLREGVSDHGVTTGPMASVVYYSLQHLTPEDGQAIAEYLGALPAPPLRREEALQLGAAATSELMGRGKTLYAKHCQDCHGADGGGRAPAYPALAGNPAVLGPPVNAVRVVANGGFAPGTAGNPRPYGMPAFVGDLSSEDIAAVLTYVRRSWGNDAPALAPVEVERDKVLPAW